jgi:putative Ca2+/H+ antiporter (TMEM165/GDT1 family)
VLFDAYAFLIVFAVIGGTEFIDRTNFALIALTAKRPPLPAWVGAATAFIATSAIAVVVGTVLIDVIGGHVVYLRLAGGIFLLGYAAYLALAPEGTRTTPGSGSTAIAAFLLIFLLELGDTTQIFMIVFVATFLEPVTVFLAGALALCCVAASGCYIGSRLGARVEPKVLDKVVIVILSVIGVVTIVLALLPGLVPMF